MRHDESTQAPLLIAMVTAVGVTLIFAVLIVRHAPVGPQALRASERTPSPGTSIAVQPGVHLRISAGDRTVERTLPLASFALEPSHSLDPSIPPGPCQVQLTIVFHRGAVRRAWIGAHIEGASVFVRRGGALLASGHAEVGEPQTVLSPTPLFVGAALQELVYDIEHDGVTPTRFRAVWQPIDSKIPLPLPSAGAPLLDSDALRGEQLAMQFNCLACHESSDAERQARLARHDAPLLGQVGARMRPAWIGDWLRTPHALKPGTSMPRVACDEESALDLTHFLVSMGGPTDAEQETLDPNLVTTGMVAYHDLGCAACHGPLEPIESLPGGRVSTQQTTSEYESLGSPAAKTTMAALSRFLGDPLRTHPGGRMPALQLTDLEARSVAAYLMDRLGGRDRAAPAPFEIDAARVERGRALFASTGCANCHALGPDRTPVESTLAMTPLESIATGDAVLRGCLSDTPSATAPDFALDESQRRHLRAFLLSLSGRVAEDVPVDHLAMELVTLNCLACHVYADQGGPEPGLISYFGTREDADLGDEGRLPPALTDVGAKLTRSWLRRVLVEHGRARPYMSTRMPEFGAANVDHLTDLFIAAAGVGGAPDDEPAFTTEAAAIGRELVGSKGLNCIQCHDIAGHEAIGTPGPDLAGVTERHRYDNFLRWLHNPSNVRPGTRMPSFFVGGVSGLRQHYGGQASEQIPAIWHYLSQGELLPLPEGLTDPSSLELAVLNEPIVFRTFMNSAGVKAIACGYPEQVHCAFDADRCVVVAVWEGQFLNASGAWANRGGSQTDPSQVPWRGADVPPIAFPTGDTDVQFLGYRLDAERKPSFEYVLRQNETEITVALQPDPRRAADSAAMILRYEVSGEPGTQVLVRSGSAVFISEGERGDAETAALLSLDESGTVSFDLEVTW